MFPWHCAQPSSGISAQERYRCNPEGGWAQNQLQRERERDIDRDRGREREFTDKEREAQGEESRAMFGMIKNSLFGNTEKTGYKLLSSETKVRGVRTELPVSPDTHPLQTWVFCASHAVFPRRSLTGLAKACLTLDLFAAVIVTPPHLLILPTYEDARWAAAWVSLSEYRWRMRVRGNQHSRTVGCWVADPAVFVAQLSSGVRSMLKRERDR